MTSPTRPKLYNRRLAGPPIHEAWTVTAGIVAVIGQKGRIALPPGATWPGVDALPDDWLEDLQPAETVAAAGSEWVDAQPADLPAGVILVHTQMLRTGPLVRRLARLDKLSVGNINQSVQAAAIGATRESVAKMRSDMRRNG